MVLGKRWMDDVDNGGSSDNVDTASTAAIKDWKANDFHF